MSVSAFKFETRMLLFIEILFLSMGALYLYYTPLWTPADEERHFACCEFIAQHRTLPVFKPHFEENDVYMAFHPPLYYMLGSLLCAADGMLLEEHILVNDAPGVITLKNPPNPPPGFGRKIKAAYLLRCLSLLLGAVTVFFVFKSAQLFFPKQLPLQAAATLFVAMNPEFTHVSASISNDNLNTALATACLFTLASFLKEPRRMLLAVSCGLLAGCALMTKSTSLFLAPLVCGAAAYVMLRDIRQTLKPAAAMIVLAAVIGGWWYARNWFLFDDPLFAKTMTTAHPWAPRYAPITADDIGIIIYRTLLSYFGHFGGSKVPLPGWFLLFYGGIVALGGAGCMKLIVARIRLNRDCRALPALYGLAVLGGLLFFIAFNLKYIGGYSGRYLFAVICPTAVIIFAGLRSSIARRFRNAAFIFLTIGLTILNAGALFLVLKPGYADPRLTMGVRQDLFDYPSPEINNRTSVGQLFVSPLNNLCGIQIIFSNPYKQSRGELRFTLRDATTRQDVRPAILCSVKKIEDFGNYYFVFPPIPDSEGKTYCFSIATQEVAPGSGIALWRSADDTYPDGNMLINDVPVDGDLFFIAYFFTGDTPATQWEGVSERALANGIYLDIWELQLYQERSKAFRQTTTTHKKFLQLQNAYKNRNASGKT